MGFPLHKAPGWGQGHSPSPKAQKAWVSHGWGTATQVPRSQDPRYQWCASRGSQEVVSREGQVLGSWRRGEKMGPWAEGAEQAPSHTDVRMYVCMCAGVGSADRAWRHQTEAGRRTATPPTPCSKNESGAASAGGATTTAPKPGPQILSTLSEQLGSENTKGYRPRPARHRPPSQPVTNALPNGPRLSAEAPWAGPRASRQPGLPSQVPPDHRPPIHYPSTATITTGPMGSPQRLTPGWRRAGRWQVGGPPLPTQGWGEGAGPGRGE